MPRSSFIRRVLVTSFVGVTFAVFAACSSSSGGGAIGTGSDATTGSDAPTAEDAATTDTSTPTPTDSGTDAAMAACTPTPDAGAACNAVVQTGTDVSIIPVNMATPTGTGGTVADGRYHTTGIATYTGSSVTGITLRQTWEFCQGIFALVGDEPGKPQYRKLAHFTTAGNVSTTTNDCSTQMPNNEVPFTSYTATPTSLTLYSSTLMFSVTITHE